MSLNPTWNAELYDNKHGFVSEFGKGVIQLLEPKLGEKILDLGCGTGDLSYEIHKMGANVIGMDLSPSMVEKAKSKYPDIRFIVGNAEAFSLEQSVDAVFSNAALHWMKKPQQVVQCVWNALNPGGRFVAEFGGKGNVETIVKAINYVLAGEYSKQTKNPWYFPSIGEYSHLLEEQGFRVAYAIHFDRPTILNDGEAGLHHWLAGFAQDFFEGFTDSEKNELYARIAAAAKKDLFLNGAWHADYIRLRIMAIKQ